MKMNRYTPTKEDIKLLKREDITLLNIIPLQKTCLELFDENKQKDKEIEKLNNIINELEKWLKKEADFWKEQQEEAIKRGWLEFGGKYNTTIIYENAIDKLKELKGVDKE